MSIITFKLVECKQNMSLPVIDMTWHIQHSHCYYRNDNKCIKSVICLTAGSTNRAAVKEINQHLLNN